MEKYAFHRKVALRALSVLLLLFALGGCGRPEGGGEGGVRVAGMLWSRENLDVARYRNGDPVPEARTEEEWHDAASRGEGAWCRSGESGCGRLYNWHAVSDPRGLAPEGWHVATDSEWRRLDALPGALRRLAVRFCGSRNCLGSLYGEGRSAFFWTADSSGAFEAREREIGAAEPDRTLRVSVARSLGLSVRCVRDGSAQ